MLDEMNAIYWEQKREAYRLKKEWSSNRQGASGFYTDSMAYYGELAKAIQIIRRQIDRLQRMVNQYT